MLAWEGKYFFFISGLKCKLFFQPYADDHFGDFLSKGVKEGVGFSKWRISLWQKQFSWVYHYPESKHVQFACKLMVDEYLFREHECWQPLHVQRARGWKWLALRGLDNLCPASSRFRPCNCHWPMGSRLKLDPRLQLLTSPSKRILFWFLMLL